MAKGEWIALEPAERSRRYIYPNDEALVYTAVSRIKVSESGTHYLDTAEGKVIVAPGWRAVVLDMDGWTF